LLSSIHPLATTDAALNATAGLLLVLGLIEIKRGREASHKRLMLAAFAVSIVFLACYLTYHLTNPPALFHGQGLLRPIYFSILISHIVLAATVPFLAGATIYLGLKDRRAAHRRLAKFTWPIWFYVSVTGVVVYFMLYILYPPVG
jgi:putative membrane protein